jgi:hypothetical protein
MILVWGHAGLERLMKQKYDRNMNLFQINPNRVEKLTQIVSNLNYHPVSFDSPEFDVFTG